MQDETLGVVSERADTITNVSFGKFCSLAILFNLIHYIFILFSKVVTGMVNKFCFTIVGIIMFCSKSFFSSAAEMSHFHNERVIDFKEMMKHFLQEQISFHQRVSTTRRSINIY